MEMSKQRLHAWCQAASQHHARSCTHLRVQTERISASPALRSSSLHTRTGLDATPCIPFLVLQDALIELLGGMDVYDMLQEGRLNSVAAALGDTLDTNQQINGIAGKGHQCVYSRLGC
jgi:hypothetical protein